MNFEFTAEQAALKDSIAAFVASTINPSLTSPADPAAFDRQLWRRCAEQGLLCLGMPEPWGTEPHTDFTSLIMALESFGHACNDNGLPFALAAQACTVQHTVLQHGSAEQTARYIPACTNGEMIGSHAMTEPQAGSDSAAMQLTARLDGNHYVLNGEKLMISLAPTADFHVVFASVNPSLGRWGITAFIVDQGTPGLNVSSAMHKMGLDSVPMGRLLLENCVIPVTQRLGPEGAGAAIASHSLEMERTGILASQVGRMQRQLESAVEYSRNRRQFGQAIGEFQAVSHRLADMRVRLETARLMLYKTAWKIDQQQPATLESSMLKLLISESFLASSMDAMRVYGGYAYIDDHHSGRDTRDALGGVLYAGTSDVQRNIIAGLIRD